MANHESSDHSALPAEVDVIIVGAGSAGAAAAIEARDQGAEILLLEKSAAAGGNCRYAAGNLLELDGEAGLEHARALAFGRTPETVLSAFVLGLRKIREWLEGLGAMTAATGPGAVAACWPHLPGASAVRYYAVQGELGPGLELWGALESALEVREVAPVTGTRVVRLTTEGDRAQVGSRVTGVEVETGGERRSVRARAGVILATGGFENAPDLCDAYLTTSSVQAISHPDNTGDGLLMAQEVGAAVWHMSNFFGFWAFRAPGHAVAFGISAPGPAHLLVDSGGRRFCSETGRETHDRLRAVGDFSPDRAYEPGFPVHLVMDRATLAAGPLSRFASPNDHRWSHDNRAELEAGWILEADGAPALARRIAVPADALCATVERFNAMARAGVDDDFHRAAATMAPLNSERLYAIPLWPGVATTAGGPQRDQHARVLRRNGDPIPGLYAIGDTGSIWGHLVEHGGALTDGLVFGRIAARHALGRATPAGGSAEPDQLTI